jgi:hypothetical protein
MMPMPDFSVNFQSDGGYPSQMPGYSSNYPHGGPEYSQSNNYNYPLNQSFEQNEQYNRLYGPGSANQIYPYPPQMPPYNPSSSGSEYNMYRPSNNLAPNYNQESAEYQPSSYPSDSDPNLRPSGYPDLSQFSNQTEPNEQEEPFEPYYQAHVN